MAPKIIETYRKDKLYDPGHGYGRNVRTDENPLWVVSRNTPMKSEVVHSTNNDDPTSIEHEAKFLRDSPNVSCHDLIAKNGDVYVILPETIVAWHAGVVKDGFSNYVSFGTELHVSKGEQPTVAQIASLTYRIQERRKKYGTKKALIDTHRAVALPAKRKTDPEGWSNGDFYAWRESLFTPVATPTPAPADGLTIQHAPRISPAIFARVLSDRTSPCAPIAQECYDICIHNSIDPAVALAFFGHESEFGTKGAATLTNSWGNVRKAVDPTRVVGRIDRGFDIFRSWQDSLQDWCERLNGPTYAGMGLTTVEGVLPKYAPTSDGNNERAYIDHVRKLVAAWEKESSVMTPEQEEALEHGDVGGYHRDWGVETTWRHERARAHEFGAAVKGEHPVPSTFVMREYTHGTIFYDTATGKGYPVLDQ